LVKYWVTQQKRAIKITKMRIKHHEIHGNGKIAMDEKFTLQKQEKHLKVIDI